jgi:hypothetical protein
MTKKIKINCILKFKIEVDLHISSCLDGKIIIIELFLLNELFNIKIDILIIKIMIINYFFFYVFFQ